MKAAIRADSSLKCGTGHVMRCLTLANILKERGAAVSFICRNERGNLCAEIAEAGFAVEVLGSAHELGDGRRDAEETRGALQRLGVHPDLLVVDHYSLDRRWEHALRSAAGRILVIDDLADRPHDCDVLLDSSLHDCAQSRYAGLVGERTRVFVGPQYALLRPEFDRTAARVRDRGVGRMLIFFGGADPSNEALKAVHALRALAARAPRTVMVLGPINPRAGLIRQAASGLTGIELLGVTGDMAGLMADADLALGACGGAAWERCILGLPALVAVAAENQRDDSRILHSLGAVRNLGDAAETTAEMWAAEIAAMLEDPAALAAMSRAARAVMQGREEARRDFEHALVR